MFSDYLIHYGIGKMNGSPGRGSGRYPLGSGEDPYQDYRNKDGTINQKALAKAERKADKADEKWAKKNTDKVTKQAKLASKPELDAYAKELMSDPNSYNTSGKLSASTINAYNRKMAQVMSQKVSDLRSPSGKVVQFVAKRGEIGVMMALATEGYDMNQLKNGVWGSGKIAYRKKVLDKVNI